MTPVFEGEDEWAQPRLSPDGTKLVLRRPGTPNCELWLRDLVRGTMTRITYREDNHDPVWGPGPGRITFATEGDRPRQLVSSTWDGSGAIEVIRAGPTTLQFPSWSSDGKLLAYVNETPETGLDIWVIADGREATPFLDTPFEETLPAVSPDGRRIAYTSNESGRDEVYVRPYPGPGGRLQISTQGGAGALWSRDGRELFYAEDDRMMVVSVTKQPEFSVSAPRVLFTGRFGWGRAGNYDVAPDGRRFVMLEMSTDVRSPDLRIVYHWLDEIRDLLPR
jgi:Tol biopolymer transport system component